LASTDAGAQTTTARPGCAGKPRPPPAPDVMAIGQFQAETSNGKKIPNPTTSTENVFY
jgi:hypothetical protein